MCFFRKIVGRFFCVVLFILGGSHVSLFGIEGGDYEGRDPNDDRSRDHDSDYHSDSDYEEVSSEDLGDFFRQHSDLGLERLYNPDVTVSPVLENSKFIEASIKGKLELLDSKETSKDLIQNVLIQMLAGCCQIEDGDKPLLAWILLGSGMTADDIPADIPKIAQKLREKLSRQISDLSDAMQHAFSDEAFSSALLNQDYSQVTNDKISDVLDRLSEIETQTLDPEDKQHLDRIISEISLKKSAFEFIVALEKKNSGFNLTSILNPSALKPIYTFIQNKITKNGTVSAQEILTALVSGESTKGGITRAKLLQRDKITKYTPVMRPLLEACYKALLDEKALSSNFVTDWTTTKLLDYKAVVDLSYSGLDLRPEKFIDSLSTNSMPEDLSDLTSVDLFLHDQKALSAEEFNQSYD